MGSEFELIQLRVALVDISDKLDKIIILLRTLVENEVQKDIKDKGYKK